MAKKFAKTFFSKKMAIIFLHGFSCGIPLIMLGATLRQWLAREGISLTAITFSMWFSIWYSWKFVWAPFMDRYPISKKFGRRRSWMLLAQVALLVLITSLGFFHPQTDLFVMSVICVFIGLSSATQDIAVDAYRRELLDDDELGLGSSVVQYGFKVSMLLGGGVGVWAVDPNNLGITWNQLYQIMGLLMLVGIFTTFWISEPEASKTVHIKTLRETIVEPFREFLKREGSIFILLFVFLYKFGDAMAASTFTPFYVHMGYTDGQIGLIAKTYGMAASLFGLFFGGVTIFYLGIYRSLWIFGIFQTLSTGFFGFLSYTGPQSWSLALVVLLEDISSGMASAAFLAFISQVCNRQYTATQYALLSSIAVSGRVFFSGFSGAIVEKVLNGNYTVFYVACALMAAPGLLMLLRMKKYHVEG
jgi:PAT family beta-lactamase induction signal transducer AmpG